MKVNSGLPAGHAYICGNASTEVLFCLMTPVSPFRIIDWVAFFLSKASPLESSSLLSEMQVRSGPDWEILSRMFATILLILRVVRGPQLGEGARDLILNWTINKHKRVYLIGPC